MLKSSSKNNYASGGTTPTTQRAAPVMQMRGVLETPLLFLLVIVAAIVGLFFAASTGQIDRVVRVEGKIIPTGRSQEVQHLEGGIIASINVTEGQAVKKGDLLVTIDGTTAETNLNESKVKVRTLQARAERLEAETKSIEPAFSQALAGTTEAAAERDLFNSRKAKLNEEISIYQSTIRQRMAELDDSQKRRASLTNELAIAKQRSAMLDDMAKRNAASKLEILEAQSRQQRLETEVSDTVGAEPKLKAAIAEEQARISTAKASFRSEAQNELVGTLAEINRLSQTMTAETDRVKRTEVRAPIDGVINRVSVNTVGGVVKPGQSLLEITPNDKEVLLETRLRPQDRGYLRPGLDANIRVSAYDAGEFGLLKGRVTDVSADSMQDPRGEAYYRVNILVSHLPKSYEGKAMLPGMTVTGDIVTGHRTILNHLLSPVRKFSYNILKDSR
jgi:adhesin transport system membrane fusion protein